MICVRLYNKKDFLEVANTGFYYPEGAAKRAFAEHPDPAICVHDRTLRGTTYWGASRYASEYYVEFICINEWRRRRALL